MTETARKERKPAWRSPLAVWSVRIPNSAFVSDIGCRISSLALALFLLSSAGCLWQGPIKGALPFCDPDPITTGFPDIVQAGYHSTTWQPLDHAGHLVNESTDYVETNSEVPHQQAPTPAEAPRKEASSPEAPMEPLDGLLDSGVGQNDDRGEPEIIPVSAQLPINAQLTAERIDAESIDVQQRQLTNGIRLRR